jgi:hypothetical protein
MVLSSRVFACDVAHVNRVMHRRLSYYDIYSSLRWRSPVVVDCIPSICINGWVRLPIQPLVLVLPIPAGWDAPSCSVLDVYGNDKHLFWPCMRKCWFHGFIPLCQDNLSIS